VSAAGGSVTCAAGEGDGALLARLGAGDEGAFEELVRRTSPRLLATLRCMLRSEEDARDALQETYLAAHRALGGFEGSAKLSTWLHRIAVNAALMKLRSRRRRPEAALEELLPKFEADGHRIVELAAPAVELEEELDDAARRAAVRRCIDRLPEAHRTVLVLRDLEELGTEETARALGISVDAAKMRLHRARQALRTLLEGEHLLGAPGRRPEPGRSGPRAAGGRAAELDGAGAGRPLSAR
jgi:RNA polymerase sigma-70 factor (ECF subfamily)